MNRTALRTLPLVAAFALAGCQSAPKFAWWKQDKAAENSAVASNSKAPALPSAQSTPQSVAIAGTTPPGATLAATTPVAGAPGTSPYKATGATTLPAVSIPVTSPATVATTSTPTYPVENSLADKLVLTPNSKAAAPSTTPGATSVAAAQGMPPMAAAGPYDPSAYKPSPTTATAGAVGNTLDADRYAMAPSGTPTQPVASLPPLATPSQSLSSDPADRYGAPRASTTPTGGPGQTAMTDPAALASDRYANPSLPALASKPTQAAVTDPVAVSPPSAGASMAPVKLASAAGQYRPGGTSSYNASNAATAPVEIASRPSPPSSTVTAPSAGTGSQPWIPTSTDKVPPARPY